VNAATSPEALRPAAAAMDAALAGALARGEFSLAWQPQVCLTSGEIVGVEALLRWDSPVLGEVGPTDFVPRLEAGGGIVEVGDWALRTACAQAAAWRAAGLPPVRVGINVSHVEFAHGDLADRVLAAAAACGLPPQALGVEITETGLLHDAERAAQALRRLQSAGVEIAMDDFGTGYSSLSRLRELPIDVVKIDRSFVHDVRHGASMTRAIIHLAHGLHRRVLAEGVETEAQLLALLAQGCDRLQGHVFAPALPPGQFAAMLARGQALPAPHTQRGVRPRTLLLVDDEAHILSALKRLFRRDGYRVLTAGSGAEGLQVLAQHAVDVIVSDQRMPGMSGVDFLRRAKELHPDTVRLTLSGYTDLQSIIDAVNEGAVYKFLTKPWDDERLREHVALAFRQRELNDENLRLSRENERANADLAAANQRLERLVAREHERVQAMQGAAGAAHDMVDAMPLAVFGLDAEGRVAYVNSHAVADWPRWAATLGDPPPEDLAALFGGGVPADGPGRAAVADGRPVRLWCRRRPTPDGPTGGLWMLMRDDLT
jgi:EAL domain-containing protein (putative c-di-GMP-specific phosphodiesterase class I)/CheY-like chemotaxis protein